MRLLMISFDYTPTQGKKTIFYHMLKEFSKYWDEISVICPKKERTKETTIHGNVTFFPVSFGLLTAALHIYGKGKAILKEKPYDLISVHEGPPFHNSLAAYFLWKKFKVPFVIEIHHVVGYPKAVDFKEWVGRFLTKIYFRYSWIWKRALGIRVVNTKEVPDFLFSMGVPKGKVLHIPSFYLDFQVFKPLDVKKEKSLVYCGRLAKNKGLVELLKAMEILKKNHPDVKLTIIGTGPLRKKIDSLVETMGLTRNVEFSGWLKDVQSVAEIYNRSEALVMTSYSEGGPRVLLEAMACGIPAIATKVGMAKELIKDGENGFLVSWEPEDIAKKMAYILEKKGKKIGQNAMETVKQFEYKKMIKNYAESYQKLVREKRDAL